MNELVLEHLKFQMFLARMTVYTRNVTFPNVAFTHCIQYFNSKRKQTL